MSYRDVSFCAWCEAKMPRWELADMDGEYATHYFSSLVHLVEWANDERNYRAMKQNRALEHALAEESEEIAAKVREEEE